MTDKFSGINTPVLSPLIRKPWWPVVTVSRDSLQDWAKVTPPPHSHCGLCLVLHHCLPPSFPCPLPHCHVGFSLEVFLIHDVQWILILRSVSREHYLRGQPPRAHPLKPLQRLWHWPSSLIHRALYVPPGTGLLSIRTSTALMICCSPLPLLHMVVLKQTKKTLG